MRHIQWSDEGIEALQLVWDFLTEIQQVPASRAEAILQEIASKANDLLNFPQQGKVLEGYQVNRLAIRFLIKRNYKIFYCFDPAKDIINILEVADTRMNPTTIAKRLEQYQKS